MVTVDLSMPQLSRFGRTLHKVYYGKGHELLEIGIMHHGYPHNGGAHSLSISHSNPANIMAFLELYKEYYPEVTEEIDLMLKQLDGMKSGIIKLINSLHSYNPDLIKSISHYDENKNPVYYDEQ